MLVEPAEWGVQGELDVYSLIWGGPGKGLILTCEAISPPSAKERGKKVRLLLTEEKATKLLLLLRTQLREWRSQ